MDRKPGQVTGYQMFGAHAAATPDLVAVDGDPFELATLPDRVAAVWQDGRLVAGRA